MFNASKKAVIFYGFDLWEREKNIALKFEEISSNGMFVFSGYLISSYVVHSMYYKSKLTSLLVLKELGKYRNLREEREFGSCNFHDFDFSFVFY